jgi:hypothetical protein
MAEPSLDLIGRQLQAIQAELREIKFAADVDRRNTRSAFDNLVTQVGAALGTFEAKVEHRLDVMGEQVGEVRDQIVMVLDRLDAIARRLPPDKE